MVGGVGGVDFVGGLLVWVEAEDVLAGVSAVVPCGFFGFGAGDAVVGCADRWAAPFVVDAGLEPFVEGHGGIVVGGWGVCLGLLFVFAVLPVAAVLFLAVGALFVAVVDAGVAEALVGFGGFAVGVFVGVFVAFGAVCDVLFVVSVFVGHVAGVCFWGGCGEVVGVDAWGVVAGVGDVVAVGDWAFVDGVGVAVGEPFLFVDL